MHPSVLILGANGRLGHALIRAYAAEGWNVIAQGRGEPPMDLPVGVLYDRTPLDLPELWSTRYPAVRVVVHAVNPPCSAWMSQALTALDAAIQIARQLNARLLFPGNVYNFDRAIPNPIRDDSPQAAVSRKGRARIALEQRLQSATGIGLRSLVIRAGEFIGATRRGDWFTDGILRDVEKGVLTYPGPRNLDHAWQDVDTLAAIFEAVGRRERAFPVFASLNAPGLTLTGDQLLDITETELRRLGLVESERPMARKETHWGLMRLRGLTSPDLRELHEPRSRWQQPHRLDGAALEAGLDRIMPSLPVAHEVVRKALLRSAYVRDQFTRTKPYLLRTP